MLKFFTIYFIFNALFVTTVFNQSTIYTSKDITTIIDPEIQEAFKFSNVVSSTIEDYIRVALPIHAKPEAEKISESVNDGLKTCESFVQTPVDLWQYKVCSSSLLRDGMAALGSLQAKYRPVTSGAARMVLFW